MREEKVIIPGAGVTLEGRWTPGSGTQGAVIAHPHPRFGGSLDNNVVWTAARAFEARGWATLRLNFRGVGESSGAYGEGVAEVDDLAAALAFLAARNLGPHYLVGYSFGAAVAARGMLQGLPAAGAVLISPPIAFMDLGFLPRAPRVRLVAVGDRDELCPLAALRQMLAPAAPPPEVAVVAGADHFWGGRGEELFQILRDFALVS
jgi:uncharacterized protein